MRSAQSNDPCITPQTGSHPFRTYKHSLSTHASTVELLIFLLQKQAAVPTVVLPKNTNDQIPKSWFQRFAERYDMAITNGRWKAATDRPTDRKNELES